MLIKISQHWNRNVISAIRLRSVHRHISSIGYYAIGSAHKKTIGHRKVHRRGPVLFIWIAEVSNGYRLPEEQDNSSIMFSLLLPCCGTNDLGLAGISGYINFSPSSLCVSRLSIAVKSRNKSISHCATAKSIAQRRLYSFVGEDINHVRHSPQTNASLLPLRHLSVASRLSGR